jgi:hypothetical protein
MMEGFERQGCLADLAGILVETVDGFLILTIVGPL